MSGVENNVMDSVLQCIRLLAEKQRVLAKNDKGMESLNKEIQEVLFDVHIALCRLASTLVTAPITGRMFLPLPQSYVTPEEQQESLCAQLGLPRNAV
ncbi:MAG: hypothetical protein EBR09_11385 [Proteobacteria bacterium]|jgi:hypothetical protein|nr:hypothetical protein [Pseudomonadota bacterium]